MLYEADDVHEAMMVHNRILILVSLFPQPRKHVQSNRGLENSNYGNIMGTMEMSM